jgi:hypothetical protein
MITESPVAVNKTLNVSKPGLSVTLAKKKSLDSQQPQSDSSQYQSHKKKDNKF